MSKSGRKKFRPLYVLNTFEGSPAANTIIIAVISSQNRIIYVRTS